MTPVQARQTIREVLREIAPEREALPGLDRASLALAATAVVHAGGHRGAGITLPGDRPPAMRKRGSRR